MTQLRYIATALTAIQFAAAGSASAAESVDFVRDVRPIFKEHCYECHGAKKQSSGLRLDVKAAAMKGGDLYDESILPKNSDDSPLIQFVGDPDADLQMPPEGDRLSAEQVATLTKWIDQGADWPDGVDDVVLEDRRDHWSFKPPAPCTPPDTKDKTWARNDIDRFILARLENAGLRPAPQANRTAWLRRVSFDLIGLPPTPEEVEAFLADESDEAYQRVVERLLHSPCYGERWAQHWLDVVRYADTHGFEVNTERPHAWPYRDYVIESFNKHTPYDQFIREQLIGEQLGQDAATGFLVTASVLLPGQIGKDAPSMRLARQDSLDEIVVNISQSFLGLSVGCARCHDHKFDPITQSEYYSMQSFVAGVEYADRPVLSGMNSVNRERAAEHTERVAMIERKLAQFVPLARVGVSPRPPTNAQKNVEEFSPLDAKFVRFTVHNANLHPSLGLIEPCVDEFEIFTAEENPRNVALAEFGTQITASGSKVSSSHRLEYINDGNYGNSRSWMADEPGRGWVLFELPKAQSIDKIAWSRDRDGAFQDRLATAYTIEAGPSLDAMTTLVSRPSPRPSVNARLNVDRFVPIKTNKLRFSIAATNRFEPCIDELEVFDVKGKNVALESSGAQVASSGDTTVADRHELRFINDGQYGNSRSWMSNTDGQGWVIVEFPEPTTIDRVVWGRDRQQKFADRLAVQYKIEVADATSGWKTVADSGDRTAYSDGAKATTEFSIDGLSDTERRQAQRLLDGKKQLEQKIAALTKTLLAFAGKFRAPDEIHRMRRGDPEQPQERVAPLVPDVLGTLELPADSAEPQRRKALADWIASGDNPMTARVMVNRIWQGHFGRALVDTPNDFGRNGAKPTHPELLDWLAIKFIHSGWSIQHLHRLIVLSATYRQATTYNEAAAAKDADVRLLWRYPTRRIDGEAIRDSILQVSGRLNLKMGGPGFDLFDKRGGLSGFTPVQSFDEEGRRRLIYAHKVRRERDAVFGAFDCPDGGQSAPRRRESTTPIQALNLFNSRFVLDQAKALSDRVKSDVGEDVEAQVDRVYELALNRAPREAEVSDAAPVVREYGLPVLCRAIFNSNEFLFTP